jgi:hypothetical protein
VRTRSAERTTVVVAVAVLSPGFGSLVVDVAVTVFASAPAGRPALKATVTRRLAVVDWSIAPIGQLTCCRVPTRDVVHPGAETTVTPAGRRSVSTTAAAVEGPALRAPSVNEVVVPAVGLGEDQAFVAVTSATVMSDAAATDVLFVETGSPAVVTVALLSATLVAVDATVPMICADTGLPTVIEVHVHSTSWPVTVHDPPPVAVAEVMAISVGTVSETDVEPDRDGPRLPTLSV